MRSPLDSLDPSPPDSRVRHPGASTPPSHPPGLSTPRGYTHVVDVPAGRTLYHRQEFRGRKPHVGGPSRKGEKRAAGPRADVPDGRRHLAARRVNRRVVAVVRRFSTAQARSSSVCGFRPSCSSSPATSPSFAALLRPSDPDSGPRELHGRDDEWPPWTWSSHSLRASQLRSSPERSLDLKPGCSLVKLTSCCGVGSRPHPRAQDQTRRHEHGSGNSGDGHRRKGRTHATWQRNHRSVTEDGQAGPCSVGCAGCAEVASRLQQGRVTPGGPAPGLNRIWT